MLRFCFITLIVTRLPYRYHSIVTVCVSVVDVVLVINTTFLVLKILWFLIYFVEIVFVVFVIRIDFLKTVFFNFWMTISKFSGFISRF